MTFNYCGFVFVVFWLVCTLFFILFYKSGLDLFQIPVASAKICCAKCTFNKCFPGTWVIGVTSSVQSCLFLYGIAWSDADCGGSPLYTLALWGRIVVWLSLAGRARGRLVGPRLTQQVCLIVFSDMRMQSKRLRCYSGA